MVCTVQNALELDLLEENKFYVVAMDLHGKLITNKEVNKEKKTYKPDSPEMINVLLKE